MPRRWSVRLSAVRIATDRVLLRKARDTDQERIIELRTDAIGGAANATATPGIFVIADKATDHLIGTVDLKRCDPTSPVT